MTDIFTAETVIQGVLCAFFIWGLFNEHKLAVAERKAFAFIKAYIKALKTPKAQRITETKQ